MVYLLLHMSDCVKWQYRGTCVIPGMQRPQQQGNTDLKDNVTVFSKDHLHFILLFHQTHTIILKKQNLKVISV